MQISAAQAGIALTINVRRFAPGVLPRAFCECRFPTQKHGQEESGDHEWVERDDAFGPMRFHY
jgi:hypothetical protein